MTAELIAFLVAAGGGFGWCVGVLWKLFDLVSSVKGMRRDLRAYIAKTDTHGTTLSEHAIILEDHEDRITRLES